MSAELMRCVQRREPREYYVWGRSNTNESFPLNRENVAMQLIEIFLSDVLCSFMKKDALFNRSDMLCFSIVIHVKY